MLLLSPALFVLRLVTAVLLPVIIIGNYLSSLVFGILSLPFVVFSRLQVFLPCSPATIARCTDDEFRDDRNYTSFAVSLLLLVLPPSLTFVYVTDEQTGISAGAILGLASTFFTDALDLRDKSSTSSSSRALGRRLKKERIKSATNTKSTTGIASAKVPARVLFPQAIPTILEEEDEDSPFLVGGAGKRRAGILVGGGIGAAAGRGRRAVGTGWSSEDEESSG
ncbi:hypothetical protein L873DRAFT_1821290 [Choiromyces venosus 120613-1]|uniref:Uncharacterized protein n=1 Tax=Choiromyces venosus 120613-1 TaxID=1336337 RepID=A0A3N4IWT7_9PEZI|nr:hypothetical protein L873DRAFT_1821290 [Choiromyces venosus 120613-1]